MKIYLISKYRPSVPIDQATYPLPILLTCKKDWFRLEAAIDTVGSCSEGHKTLVKHPGGKFEFTWSMGSNVSEQEPLIITAMLVDESTATSVDQVLAHYEQLIPIFKKRARLFTGLLSHEIRRTFFRNLAEQSIRFVLPNDITVYIMETMAPEVSIETTATLGDLFNRDELLAVLNQFDAITGGSDISDRLATAINFVMKAEEFESDYPIRFVSSFTAIEVLCDAEGLTKKEKKENLQAVDAAIDVLGRVTEGQVELLNSASQLLAGLREKVNQLAVNMKFERYARRLQLESFEDDIKNFRLCNEWRNNLVHDGMDAILAKHVFIIEKIAKKYLRQELSILSKGISTGIRPEESLPGTSKGEAYANLHITGWDPQKVQCIVYRKIWVSNPIKATKIPPPL